MSPSSFLFGPHLIRQSEVFLTSTLSFAFVNLKPILPGHVLVCPRRIVPRFKDLDNAEVSDLFLLVHKISDRLERIFNGTAMTISIQDGSDAGQSVPHVHVHVIPRRKGDFARNDDIYQEINGWKVDADEDREPRTLDEMAKEAEFLREQFNATIL